jgi:Raf kinase inhibitor-like YbhB/YbcL family protein
MRITSKAFSHGKQIPEKYAGEGEDISPDLAWHNVPQEATELAIICDDPDAPVNEPWVHWVVYRIPTSTSGLPENIPRIPILKNILGARQGKNSWEQIGYGGPMPPPGHGIHRFFFKLYALAKPIDIKPGATKDELMKAMKGYVAAETTLMGTYKRD